MSDVRRVSDRRVPNVPPLDGIVDPEVRSVLEALTQGWQVRNGQAAATDDYRFITKADLKQWINEGSIMAGAAFGSGSLGGGVSGGPANPTPIQQWVNSLVQQATDIVRNSEFFQFLGQRIDAIGPPLEQLGAQATQMTTLIRNETSNRSNADNAIVETLNQVFAGIATTDRPIWAMKTDGVVIEVTNAAAFAQAFTNLQSTVGNQTIALQQEASTRATADGQLFGQWSVKIDAAGYVAGFGLNSQSPSYGPATSEFYVRADRFAIGSPGVPRPIVGRDADGNPIYGDAPPANIPFVVFTTPQTSNGKTVPPGVYMTDAFIQNGAIGTAKIGVAAIDTLVVGGRAITAPFYATAPDTALTTTPSTLASVAVTFPDINYATLSPGAPSAPAGVIICAAFYMGNETTGHALSSIHFEVWKNGTFALFGTAISIPDGSSTTCIITTVDPAPGLFNSYSLVAFKGDNVYNATAYHINISAFGSQR